MSLNFLSKIIGKHIEEEQENLAASIQEHLQHLLNVRQGMTPHLPEYGLPDIQEIFYNLPGSLEQLATLIERTISRYEPRLTNVRVKLASDLNLVSAEDFRAAYRISADLVEGAIQSRLTFHTQVERDGRATAQLVKQYG